MGKIDMGRVVLGGIVAGIIIDIFEYVLNGIVLANDWTNMAAAHNLPMLGMHEIIAFNVMGIVLGIAAVWTYAAIRPRFGAGPKTAVYAALVVWVVGYLLADAMPLVIGLFPMSLFVALVGVGLVEIIVATIAGAYFYNEPA
jgi:hypothetical protein